MTSKTDSVRVWARRGIGAALILLSGVSLVMTLGGVLVAHTDVAISVTGPPTFGFYLYAAVQMVLALAGMVLGALGVFALPSTKWLVVAWCLLLTLASCASLPLAIIENAMDAFVWMVTTACGLALPWSLALLLLGLDRGSQSHH